MKNCNHQPTGILETQISGNVTTPAGSAAGLVREGLPWHFGKRFWSQSSSSPMGLVDVCWCLLHFGAILQEMSPVLFWKADKLPTAAQRLETVEVLIAQKYQGAKQIQWFCFVHEHQSKSIECKVQIVLSSIWLCELPLWSFRDCSA